MCNTIPLDKPKENSTNKPVLPYITWGLIWDTKIEDGILKNKVGIPKLKMGY